MLECVGSLKFWVSFMMCEFHTPDCGHVIHRVDASACRAIMLRRGCGGLKHISVKSLWVQEAVRDNAMIVKKIPRDAMHAQISCLSIQRGRFKETPHRVKWLSKHGVRGGRALMRGPRAGWEDR